MSSPYLVPVKQLVHSVPSHRDLDLLAPFDASHEFVPRPFAESDVPLDAEVHVAVRLESFRGGVSVRGVVESPWRGLCRRCSSPIFGELVVAVDERFLEQQAPDDDEAYPLEGDFLDLLPMVHDVVLLELPIAPLCRPECKGLCPFCGVDRNEVACTCATERDERWATLDALRFEDEGSSD